MSLVWRACKTGILFQFLLNRISGITYEAYTGPEILVGSEAFNHNCSKSERYSVFLVSASSKITFLVYKFNNFICTFSLVAQLCPFSTNTLNSAPSSEPHLRMTRLPILLVILLLLVEVLFKLQFRLLTQVMINHSTSFVQTEKLHWAA